MSDHMNDTVDDPERGYTLERTFNAPKALVWRAITEADLFATWFGADTPLEIHQWDLRPQGEWKATMTYEGNEMPWAGRFLEVDEPDKLVVAFVDAPVIEDVFDVMTYTLTEHGDSTELVLRQHGGHLTDEQYEQAKEGTASFLDALAKVVASL
ncbi:MAG: hypothetical protein JWM89_2273 [Acidimicrobiales bacterium]|nr:hypothetical protein [Acidimicrobiales bacterium]